MIRRKQLTPAQAYQKLKHFCAWQERCHQEVKIKAYSLGLKKAEVEELTAKLAEEDCLNEERFARQFAGGRFRMKQWGRVRIRTELRNKRVSDYCILTAIAEIPEKDYQSTLLKLAVKKWNSITGPGVNLFVKKAKTQNYLLQKGYEAAYISRVLSELAEKK